ncbi:hypothetical protein PHET_02173 [Paragonimus heterotremus]|uniref:RRM domain-containing protein n=1 Tax=Paragonimus heterotremus TaxID=100268 RepID=A0A8J4TDB8_9TREM|nr:hypothetical protein PHET_02173 [Paragonimus heterotremus]
MRSSQPVVIDPRKVAPSRHSLFICGFPGTVKIDSIKEFFSNQSDGRCRLDFSGYSEDRSQVFVAVRFESHSMARRMLIKYDGEKVFGHKININWFRDIRKARKKAICRMGVRRCVTKQTGRHAEKSSSRHRSSYTSKSRSRSSSCSKATHRSRYTRRKRVGSNRRRSSSSDSSGSSRQLSSPQPERRVCIKQNQGRNSSDSSSRSSSSSTVAKQQPRSYQFCNQEGDKEILQAALEACSPVRQQTVNQTRSISINSRTTEVEVSVNNQYQSTFVAEKESSHDESNKERSPKRKKLSRKKQKKKQRTQTPPLESAKSPSTDPVTVKELSLNVENAQANENNIKDEDVHAMLEVEEISLNSIFLPDEHPDSNVVATNETAKINSLANAVEQEHTPMSAHPLVTEEAAESQTENVPLPPQSANHETTTELCIPVDVQLTEASQPAILNVGTQVDFSLTEKQEFEDSLIQLSLLTDAKMDEIFQKKRFIEAAYRLDCENLTVSISNLIRLNPDLKDRLIASLRSLLEERARQSVNELREMILKIRR